MNDAWIEHKGELQKIMDNPLMRVHVLKAVLNLIRQDDFEPLRFLLVSDPSLMGARLEGGMTLLNAAAQAGSVRCLDVLVRLGADTTSDVRRRLRNELHCFAESAFSSYGHA